MRIDLHPMTSTRRSGKNVTAANLACFTVKYLRSGRPEPELPRIGIHRSQVLRENRSDLPVRGSFGGIVPMWFDAAD